MAHPFSMQYAGSWTPVSSSQLSSNYSGSIAYGFQSLVKINGGQYGLVVTGWNYSGLINNQPVEVKIGLFVPDPLGNLTLQTDKYVSDPSTNGSGSVVVADFNNDGLEDIFLAAHTEHPMVPLSSTVYLQKPGGVFSKMSVGDKIIAHDAKLIYFDNQPMVLTSTFDASNRNQLAVVNPIYVYGESGAFQTLAPVEYWYDVARKDGSATWYANLGMTAVVDAFGANGEYFIVRGDNATYTNDWARQLTSDISVYSFGKNGQDSNTPTQRITPYLSTLDEYKNYDSLFGKGLTHVYRIWSDDFNHDGFPDLIAAQSMWKEGQNNWPNALQLLQNNGKGLFNDQTKKLNHEMSLDTDELSYTPLIMDIDNSGIDSYLFSNHGTSTYQRQTNYVLLNDGTGKIHIALHDEFVDYARIVSAYLQENKNLFPGISLPVYPYGTPVSFIPIPQSNGELNFLAQIQSQKSDPSNQTTFLFVNFNLGFNVKTDFLENISITDRNQSMLMRTWAGNDTFFDINANAAPAKMDGGLGLDTSRYSDQVASYTIRPLGSQMFEVKHTVSNNFSNVSDTLTNIERLKFSDTNVALDVGPSQNAGSVYMLYKAAFNRAPDQGGMGYWLAQVDGGKNLVNDIATGFVKAPEFVAKYGANPTNAFYVDQLYLNVLGRPGEAGGVAYWNQELNSGARSKAEVLVQFATLPEGAALVANLIANGIPYQEWIG